MPVDPLPPGSGPQELMDYVDARAAEEQIPEVEAQEPTETG